MEQKFVNAIAIAKLLGVSVGWVTAHSTPSAKVRLPVVWIGGRKRFDPEEVLQWVRNANETPRENV